MERGSPSETAIGAAFIRAHHCAHDEDRIFADSLAHLLITPAESEAFEARYEDRGPAELQDRYFKNRRDGFRAPDHFHFARAGVGQA